MREFAPPGKKISDEWQAPAGQKALSRMYRLAGMGELLDGIAHNFNTPLSAVIARAEMLRDRMQGIKHEMQNNPADAALISKLDKSIRDAEVIVTNALKLSDNIKNMMNKRLHEDDDVPQMISLNHLVREELQFLDGDMTFKHEITKSCSLDESLPAVKGVYHHFSQSIVQIIRNIVDSFADADKKELTIISRRDDASIYLEFRDTGLDPGNSCKDSCATRLEKVTELLHPYGATLTVVRSPRNNLHTISIPCAPAG